MSEQHRRVCLGNTRMVERGGEGFPEAVIRSQYQFGDGQFNRLREFAEALVRLKVDVIVTVDTPPPKLPNKQPVSSLLYCSLC
jgi:hypothetical protein